jgi:hypothetical protein
VRYSELHVKYKDRGKLVTILKRDAIKAHGGVQMYLHAFLPSTLDGSKQPLYSGLRASGTHWVGGWMDLRAGLDVMKERKSLAPAENRTPSTQPSSW